MAQQWCERRAFEQVYSSVPPTITMNDWGKFNLFGELYGDPKARMATAEELIAEMDAAGVDMAVTFGL